MQTNEHQRKQNTKGNPKQRDLASTKEVNGRQPDSERQNQANDASGDAPLSPDKGRTPVNLPIGFDIGAIFVTIATVASAVFAWYQLGLTRDALQLTQDALTETRRANDNAVTTQRAFLNYSEPQTRDNTTAGGQVLSSKDGSVLGLRLNFQWINSGGTPALRVNQHVNYNVFESNLPENFDFPDTPTQRDPRFNIVGPSGHLNYRIEIPIQYLQDAQARKNRLFVWAWVTYNDVLTNSPRRLTESCNEVVDIVGPLAVPKSTIRFTLSQCRAVFNCYDHDCPDYQQRTKGQPRGQP
jgi:hypothetical protein